MNSFRSPPPIEPLSDLSWRRLEEELVVAAAEPSAQALAPTFQTSPTRWKWVAATGGVLAAAAALLFVLTNSFTNESSPSEQSSLPSSRLVTGDSPSTMSVGDATLVASSDTALYVRESRADKSVEVLIERGSAHFQVAPRKERPPFVVVAGDVRVEVVGTAFRVSRVGDSATVSVDHGVVNVVASGQQRKLTAGETWPAASTEAPTHPDEPKTPDPSDGQTAQADDSENTKAKARADERQAKERAAAERAANAEAKRQAAKERYARASALELKNPAGALTLYRQLAAERGAWSANALFAMARLELERGQRAKATTALRRYLKRNPRRQRRRRQSTARQFG